MGLFDKKDKKTVQRATTDISHSASEAAAILGTAPPMPIAADLIQEDDAARKIQSWWKNGTKKLEKSFTIGAKPKVVAAPVASSHVGYSNAQVSQIDKSMDDFMKTLGGGEVQAATAVAATAAAAGLTEEQAARKIQTFWRSAQNYPPIDLQNRTALEHVVNPDQGTCSLSRLTIE